MVVAGAESELRFAAMTDALAADPDSRAQLTDLLREDHPSYEQRGAAAVVRMRGWVLLALARTALLDAALVFVLEELETGTDAYLVAAAARALRAYPDPTPALAPFVMRALANIRYHDEPVSLEAYGDYAVASAGTSPVRELLETLVWLGPHARELEPELMALRNGVSRRLRGDVDRALRAIRGADRDVEPATGTCCELPGGVQSIFSWAPGSRSRREAVGTVQFEDHDGALLTFDAFFRGRPSIITFFYTRCDNPLKCSLTVTQLARIQTLLERRGLTDLINTAAITYDPAFDRSDRLRAYAANRGVRLGARHRILRATQGADTLRSFFNLGVNFVGSLVNRHRIELYVLDAEGRVAASFERLRWDEQQVVDHVVRVLNEGRESASRSASAQAEPPAGRAAVSSLLGTLASLGVVLFPKCPVCWAGYLSLFGIAGLQRVPYTPWLQPVLATVMLVNVASVWLRIRATGRMGAFYLASTGALAILASKLGPSWQGAAPWGIALTLAGSMWSVLGKHESSRARWKLGLWRTTVAPESPR
jgi:protein SCO1/2